MKELLGEVEPRQTPLLDRLARSAERRLSPDDSLGPHDHGFDRPRPLL